MEQIVAILPKHSVQQVPFFVLLDHPQRAAILQWATVCPRI